MLRINSLDSITLLSIHFYYKKCQIKSPTTSNYVGVVGTHRVFYLLYQYETLPFRIADPHSRNYTQYHHHEGPTMTLKSVQDFQISMDFHGLPFRILLEVPVYMYFPRISLDSNLGLPLDFH